MVARTDGSAGRAARHVWGDPVAVRAGPSGCQQTERVCKLCGLVRVTVHPPQGLAWREWRHPASAVQFRAPQTPPCRVDRVAADAPAAGAAGDPGSGRGAPSP